MKHGRRSSVLMIVWSLSPRPKGCVPITPIITPDPDPHLLITFVANALRYGDDVVQAASARAFDAAAGTGRGEPMLGRGDRAFIAGLVAIGAALLVAT